MTKIVFLSTSSRPLESLKKLKDTFDICLIVTKTDRSIGKSKKKVPNKIKTFAQENNIRLFEIEKMDSFTKDNLQNTFTKLNPDLAVTFDFGYIIPKNVLDIPSIVFINIHFSLLPKYRGASAVQFAILNDEKEYGITYHLIDANLDTGDILYQSKYNLDESLNSEEAYQYLFNKASVEIVEVINNYLSGKLTPTKQNSAEASYTYSNSKPKSTFIFKEDAFISEFKSERELYRQIKAYNPWPKPQVKASFFLKLNQFQRLELKKDDPLVKINDANYQNNKIEITEVTILNGKTLVVKDFISGYFKKM